MKPEDFYIEDAIAILERTPASIGALLRDMPDVWTRATEGEGKWSPYQVVLHLVHGEQANWIPRARHILSGEPTPFAPFDQMPQWAEGEGKSLSELLATFKELRARNIDELRAMNLGESDFKLIGQHPDFGQVTLGQLVATWVVHDLDHVAQIARTMAKVYGNAVGPWQAYLSILRDREGKPQ